MHRYVIVFTIGLFNFISFLSSYAANQQQLTQFLSTNVCLNCDLNNASFPGGRSYANAMLTHAILINAKFEPVNLSVANFFGANMKGISLMNCTLTAANFSNAILQNAILVGANLQSANFNGTVVTGANFQSANLKNARITAAQLASAQSLCNAILPNGIIAKCQKNSTAFPLSMLSHTVTNIRN